MDDDAPRTARLLGVPLVVTLAALVGAALVGFAVGSIALTSSSGEGFADLAAVLLGMMAAAVVLALAWLIGIAAAARRLFVRGRRLLPVGLSLAVMVVAVVVMVVGANTLGADATGMVPGRWAGVLGGLLVLSAGSVGFWGAARIYRSRGGAVVGPSTQPSGSASASASAGPHEPGA